MPPSGPRAREAMSVAPAWPAGARLFRHLAALAGWRRAVALFFAGALGALALPPLHWVPFILCPVALAAALLAHSAGWRRSFVDGWWIGFGFFAAGCYWVAEAFFVDAERFGWLAPPVVGGLAAYLGLSAAAASALARALPVRGI